MERKTDDLPASGENARVLIVDDEPIIGNLLEVGLSEAGFAAEYFSNAANALENVRHYKPDIIISDTLMPRMDGYELRRRLRQDPETSGIPFVFLSPKTESPERLESVRTGTDDYVHKPFKIERLIDRMRHVMERAATAKTFQTQAGFSGNLAQMDLSDVVQIVGLNQKSGAILFKDAGKKEIGRLCFREGKLVNAQRGLLAGDEAFYALMGRAEGHFEFHNQEIEGPDLITEDTRAILLKGRRMIEASERLNAQLPDKEMLEITTPDIPRETIEKGEEENLQHILTMISEGHNLRDILHCGVMSRIRAGSLVDKLLQAGAISVRGQPEPVPAPVPEPIPVPIPDPVPGIGQERHGVFPMIEEGFLKVLKSFERGALTGVLEIRERPERSAIFFQQGEITHAYHGNAVAKKALFRIFGEKGGAFKFKLQTVTVRRTVQEGLDVLLDEGNQEIEKLRRLRPSTFENRVTINEEALSKINGRPGLKHVLALARQNRRIKDIIDASEMSDFQTYRHLFYMVKTGMFSVESESNTRIQVVTDSTADLPGHILADRNILLTSPEIQANRSEGMNMTPEILQLNRRGALPGPGKRAFHELFREIAPEKDILALLPSGKISRSVEEALAAKEGNHHEYLRLRRQRTWGSGTCHIEIMDTHLLSSGLGLLVTEAADKAEEGWPMDKLRDHIARLIPMVRVFFVVPASGHLRLGGRVRGLLAYILRMRPVLGLWKGEVTVIDQVRGGKDARRRIIEWIKQSLDQPETPIRVGIMHAQASEWAREMKHMLHSHFNCQDIILSPIRDARDEPSPGTVAVAFFPSPHEEQVIFKSYGKPVWRDEG